MAIVDGAVSGDTTAGGRARLDWALADGADAAIVELGGNDGLRGIDPAATAANLAAILDALAARRIPVLLSGMLAPPNLGPEYGQEFRAVFDRLGARAGVLYDPFFLAGVARDPVLNQPDGIHPNPEAVTLAPIERFKATLWMRRPSASAREAAAFSRQATSATLCVRREASEKASFRLEILIGPAAARAEETKFLSKADQASDKAAWLCASREALECHCQEAKASRIRPAPM